MFKRAIVLDIVTHPGMLTDDVINKLTVETNTFKLNTQKKPAFFQTLPANTIIGSFVHNKNVFIALPFFSSHMSLPLKLQEEVWIYEDTTASKEFEMEYYWVSRIHGTNFYEDANYTHSDRKYLRNYDTKIDKPRDNNIPVALFNNGPVRKIGDGETGDNNLNAKDKKIKENLNLSSKHALEDVPRTIKNPGDYIIQGSNNTLIRLGTNQIRKANKNYLESYNNSIFFKEPEPYSGTIDIVAGRAAISQSQSIQKNNVNYIKDDKVIFSKNITTRAFKNSQFVMYNENENSENLKDNLFYFGKKNYNFAEGDPDFATDISRLLISEYINGDELLNYNALSSISIEGKQEKVNNNVKRGFIIAKSDEIRLFARNDIIAKEHTNNNQLEGNNSQLGSGSIRLIKEGNGLEDQAHLVLNSNGHISIDGPTIVLGDKSRMKENGTGDSIYLGNDSHEPGVLGYMLKNKLENFMDETIRALNIIGLCLKDLDTHIHPYAGPAGQTFGPLAGPPAPVSTLPAFIDNSNFSTWPATTDTNAAGRSGSLDDKTGNYGPVSGMGDATSKKLEDKIKDISTIRDSLNDILSKFVKTL